MSNRVEVRDDRGRLVGHIERCEHGSRFVQAKQVRAGSRQSYGLEHRCVSLDLDPLARLRAAGYRESISNVL